MGSGNKGSEVPSVEITSRNLGSPYCPVVVCCGNCGTIWGKPRGRGYKNTVGEGHKLGGPRSCSGSVVVCRWSLWLPTAVWHTCSILCSKTHEARLHEVHGAKGRDRTRHATAYVCDFPGSRPLLLGVGLHRYSAVVPFAPLAGSLSPWECLLFVVVLRVPRPRPRSLCWGCRPCSSSPCPLVWALRALLLLLPACTRPGPLVWSLPAGLTAVGLPLLGGVVPQQVSGEAVGGLSVLARLQRALPPGSRRELGFAVSCVVLRCCLWLLQSGHLRGHWLVPDGCGGEVLFEERCPVYGTRCDWPCSTRLMMSSIAS